MRQEVSHFDAPAEGPVVPNTAKGSPLPGLLTVQFVIVYKMSNLPNLHTVSDQKLDGWRSGNKDMPKDPMHCTHS